MSQEVEKVSLDTLNEITQNIQLELTNSGFEIKPFKIGWYNDKVDKRFALSESYDTIGYLIISTPVMFEKSFLPFICKQECTGVKDPLDQCVAHYFQQIKQKFPTFSIESIHDYEMHPSRRPKILVQTVAHVSGAAYFYQRSDVNDDPWEPQKKMCGVCIHPKYGGWFALRGVLIFKNLECKDLIQQKPIDIIPEREKRISLLEKFNYSWQDWTYRDLCETIDKYSEDQKQYFATAPKDRMDLIISLREKHQTKKELCS